MTQCHLFLGYIKNLILFVCRKKHIKTFVHKLRSSVLIHMYGLREKEEICKYMPLVLSCRVCGKINN